MAKERTYREFRQGIYKPLNKKKCLNTTPVIFRSFLEARLFKILDTHENVIKWSSEQTVIPYVHPIKTKQNNKTTLARYFVDIYVEMNIDGINKKYLLEIKPHGQTLKPTPSNRKKPSTIIYENAMYAINQAKWDAAKKYAHKKGMEFLVITENNINLLEGKK
jgi:hypothetical protein